MAESPTFDTVAWVPSRKAPERSSWRRGRIGLPSPSETAFERGQFRPNWPQQEKGAVVRDPNRVVLCGRLASLGELRVCESGTRLLRLLLTVRNAHHTRCYGRTWSSLLSPIGIGQK